MRVVSLTGATSVVDPEHGEHHAGPDGVFELPLPFAEHLTKTAAGVWRGEAEHLSQTARESLDHLRDPRVALHTLSDLRSRVEALEAQVAELAASAPPAEAAPKQEQEQEQESAVAPSPDDDGDGEEPVEGGETPEPPESPEEPDDEAEQPEEEPEPEEAPKPTTRRRPGTDTPPRVRPAAKPRA